MSESGLGLRPPTPGARSKSNSPSFSLPIWVRRSPSALRRLACGLQLGRRARPARSCRAAHRRARRLDLARCCLLRSCGLGQLGTDARPMAARWRRGRRHRPEQAEHRHADRAAQRRRGRANRSQSAASSASGGLGDDDNVHACCAPALVIADATSRPASRSRDLATRATSEPAIAAWSQRARWLDALDQLLRPSLPAALAGQCRLANVDGPTRVSGQRPGLEDQAAAARSTPCWTQPAARRLPSSTDAGRESAHRSRRSPEPAAGKPLSAGRPRHHCGPPPNP